MDNTGNGVAGSAHETFIRSLCAEHATALLRHARRLTGGDQQRAEDLVQETIIRAWRHPQAFEGRPARPWLLAVLRNLAIDSHRARQARPPEVAEGELDLNPAEDHTDRMLTKWAIMDAITVLQPGHRQILLETYYHDRSVAETASVLGIPEGTVKSRTYYALRALKVALEERGLAP